MKGKKTNGQKVKNENFFRTNGFATSNSSIAGPGPSTESVHSIVWEDPSDLIRTSTMQKEQSVQRSPSLLVLRGSFCKTSNKSLPLSHYVPASRDDVPASCHDVPVSCDVPASCENVPASPNDVPAPRDDVSASSLQDADRIEVQAIIEHYNQSTQSEFSDDEYIDAKSQSINKVHSDGLSTFNNFYTKFWLQGKIYWSKLKLTFNLSKHKQTFLYIYFSLGFLGAIFNFLNFFK